MADRISTLDAGYRTGDLSVFPFAVDDWSTLYRATNNGEAVLVQSLTYTGKFLVVDDATTLPAQGIVRVGTELVYYGSRNQTVLRDLKRGFAGSGQRPWPIGTPVQASVMAEHHNAVVDAVVNIQNKVGTKETPAADSLNGLLKGLEQKFLSPKPLFHAAPRVGPPPLAVTFQNFSGAPTVRFLWDFGDGGTSVETSPTHTYVSEGTYTVTLNIITSLGGTGVTTKKGYVVVSEKEALPFFYATPAVGDTFTQFTFVDQTQGDIASRYWIWDDGTNTPVSDPDEHVATHTYAAPGVYAPNLLVVYTDNTIKRVSLNDSILVTE
jgi:PKD repeat protein